MYAPQRHTCPEFAIWLTGAFAVEFSSGWLFIFFSPLALLGGSNSPRAHALNLLDRLSLEPAGGVVFFYGYCGFHVVSSVFPHTRPVASLMPPACF